MNPWVKEAMDSQTNLPQTMEEYQTMSHVAAKRVPMAHVAKLKDEFMRKSKQKSADSLRHVDFDSDLTHM